MVISMVAVLLPFSGQSAQGQTAQGQSAQSKVPTNLAVATESSGFLNVTWTLAEGTSGATVRWRVQDKDPAQSGSQPGPWLSASPGFAEQHFVSGLVDGVVYEVAVRAVVEADGTPTDWTQAVTGTPAPNQNQIPAAAAQLSAVTFAISTDGATFAGKNLLNPSFSGGLTSYHATVDSNVTHLKMTPTASVGGATLTGGVRVQRGVRGNRPKFPNRPNGLRRPDRWRDRDPHSEC